MKLNPLARSGLQRLIDEGHTLDPLADFDSIAEISELADQATHPRPCIVTDAILDAPVTAGGVQFRALSIAAHLWLRDVAGPALAGDDYLLGLAVPYAMANREAVTTLSDPGKIRRAIKHWVRVSCRDITDAQVESVFRHFGIELTGDGDEDEETREAGREQYGNILALLMREYNGTPEYWLFDAPQQVIETCIKDVLLKAHLEHEAHRRSSAKGGKAEAPDPNSPAVQAHCQMINRIRAFRESKAQPEDPADG